MQIRSFVFETNSSSVHSIAIPKECPPTKRVHFKVGEFGWDFKQVDAADYLYTALYENSQNEKDLENKLNRLKEILDEHGIKYSFVKPKTHDFYWKERDEHYLVLDDGYIDHAGELIGFVEDLLEDGEKLIRFISGGTVFTGNDNCCDEDLYHKDSHYEWFYKGN